MGELLLPFLFDMKKGYIDKDNNFIFSKKDALRIDKKEFIYYILNEQDGDYGWTETKRYCSTQVGSRQN